jgi:hypothetical protein
VNHHPLSKKIMDCNLAYDLKLEEVNGGPKRLIERMICTFFLNSLISNLEGYNFGKIGYTPLNEF